MRTRLTDKKDDNEDDDSDLIFTHEDIKVFDQHREKRLAGESKVYTRPAARDIITGKIKE
jgi:hypothetical protein